MQKIKPIDNCIVPNFDALKQRVNRFLVSTPKDRCSFYGTGDLVGFSDIDNCLQKEYSAKKFIKDIEEVGEVAIFGGLLRDLCLETNRTFCSDIDIVVETDDERGLASKVAEFDAVKNSFGGYRLQYHKWSIDLWSLKNTWAFKEGLVKEESFDSLLKTTFFNWDAVVLNSSKSKIYSIENYLKKLNDRVVDINLKENPNDIGILVRALRLLEKRNAKFSYNLSEYVFFEIENHGVDKILNDELDSYGKNLLTDSFISSIYLNLQNYLENNIKEPFCHKFQLSLFD